ncbi:MAG: choice-of-anchor L domain-containing protein, partial [Cytophagaceae bacterium]|nr:choice-of-anchor L domain-containing protein [Cytophagaceae bacterium]
GIISSGKTVNFTNTSTGATTYAWQINGEDIDNSFNFSATLTADGIYTITLVASNGEISCTDTYSVTIEVECNTEAFFEVSPVSPIGSVVYINSGITLDFTNTSTGASSYEWYLDANPVSNSDNYSHNFDTPGEYNITLIASNDTCQKWYGVHIDVADSASVNVEFQDPEDAVKKILTCEDIQVFNIVYKGNTAGLGSFQTGTGIGLSEGIILSSGDVKQAKYKYSEQFLDAPGDPDLTSLVSLPTNDASVLEFDFIPTYDSLVFRYVFASDEYEEFVCTNFNDVFAFFLSGPGIGGQKNLALVPNTNLPVSVNTINNGNVAYDFFCIPQNSLYYINNPSKINLGYDGYTKVLSVNEKVTPGLTYHIKLAIADVFDATLSSAVLIEAKSFGCNRLDLISSQPCPNDTYTFTVIGPGISTNKYSDIEWNFGDGTAFTGSQSNITHSYNSPGNYLVSCVVNYSDGKSDSLTESIIVYEKFILESSADTTQICRDKKINLNSFLKNCTEWSYANIKVKLTLDIPCNAQNVSWQVKNKEGKTVLSGGNYPYGSMKLSFESELPPGIYYVYGQDINGKGWCNGTIKFESTGGT